MTKFQKEVKLAIKLLEAEHKDKGTTDFAMTIGRLWIWDFLGKLRGEKETPNPC